MKVPLLIFVLYISYVLGDIIVKYGEKNYPKKVRRYGNGKILINTKYEYKSRTKTTTTVSTPSTKKSYTVFQVVGNPKIEGVPDSPYFSDDHAFNHKARVKKNLPDYVWSAVRVKRDTEEKIKTTTDNKAKVEQKSTTLSTITNSGKVESPTMRNIQEKNADAKEANGGTTITNEANTERKVEKDKETHTKEAVTKAQKKTHSKASKKNEKVVVDIKTANNTNILRKPKSKAKSTDSKKERANRNTKSKGVVKNKPKEKGVKDASKLEKKVANDNKLKKNETIAKGAVTKKNKKQKKRKLSGKNSKRSKARSKSKVKKNEKSKSANATRTAAKIPKAQRRLISAREALIEDYPYMVSIQKDGQHWCSGALLNPRLVITTANCLWKANRVSRMQVRAGSRYIDRGGQLVSIQEVMKHPAWGLRKSPDNDVALLLLDKNIRFSHSTHGVDIPNRVMLPPFDDAWVTSWGSERRDGIYDSESTSLQVYHTRLMDHEKCNNVTMRFSVIVSENFICLAQSGRSGPCTRDTGAPAVSDGVLWGLASWGIRKLCGTERYPSMFSYLASHSNLDFIANATRFLMADKRHYPFVDRFPVLNN